MKKKLAILSVLTPFLTASTTLAVDIVINEPTQGYKTIGDFVTNIITIAFAIALLLVLVYLIWGAFDWITSGGDKEAVAKARNKIINALIGLAVLAVAFALARLAAQFLGFPDITRLAIPTPNPSPP